jgi:hypothetical protein
MMMMRSVRSWMFLASLAALYGSPAAADPATFQAGAGVGDMTPPPFDAAAHVPDLDVPGFDGPRQWQFQEPYIDLNGNAYWDPGEPYLDVNHNLRYDGMYLGGGGGRDSRPPTKVADPITARAFVVDNGARRIAVEVLDTIGTFNTDLDAIRARARAELPAGALDEIFISSTHNESAPDVVGLWGSGLIPEVGNGILSSGVNDYWMDYAIQQAAQAIVDAYNAREPAVLRLAETTQPANFLTCWSSYPYVRASKIPVMQAASSAVPGRVIFTLMNYGIHAETLGFNGGTEIDSGGATLEEEKYWLSADWPYWARQKLEDTYGGVAIQMAGAVGSVETPKVFADGSVSLEPTGQNDPGHPAGCRTIFSTTGDPVPLGYFRETREVGERAAARVIDALAGSSEVSSSTEIAFARRKFFVPVTNLLFIGAGLGQTFPRRPTYVAGIEIPQVSQIAADLRGTLTTYDPPSPNAGLLEVKTEVAAFRIGDAEFISTPGEEFPIGYVRGFQGPDDMPFPADAMTAWVTPHMTRKYRFIEGLGEDMIGYLFPKANAVGVPGERDLDLMRAIEEQDPTAAVVGTDRFGCGHSDDSEAASGDAGNIVSDAAIAVLGELGSTPDRVLLGRYLFADGTKRRNPLGDGALGCDGDLRVFTPAGSAPSGVIVRDCDTTRTITFASGAAVSWIDYNGVEQSAPTVDTRGVKLADETRIYVDVYPEASF